MLSVLLLLFSIAAFAPRALAAQTPPPQPDSTPTFTSRAQLVVRTVSVRDKEGKAIEGLAAKDFTIMEDGKPQTISVCEFQKLDDPVDQAAALSFTPDGVQRVTRNAFAIPAPGNDSYRNRRLLAMYFDMSSMPVSDQLRALTGARRFVETQMGGADLLAIMTFAGGSVRVEQDFTSDRPALLKTIQSLVVGEGQGIGGNPNDASSADTGAAFGQDDKEFNVFNTDRQLAALQTATAMLSQLHERKALLYFASGIALNGLNNQAQLTATINAAIRGGVAFWPVDARGLVAQAPMGDASQAAPGGVAMYSGASAQAAAANFDRSQDTLWTLAADTGGKALLNYNDLSRGIVQAQQSVSSYYILGYYSSNAALDGRYRKIRIAVNAGSVNLNYEPGYYAGKSFKTFTGSDKERQLEEALMLGNPTTELTIALQLNYFRLNRAEYFVPLTVKIPGKELALARRGGADRTIIDFIGEVKDEFGATIANLRDKVDVRLSGQTAMELAKQPVDYEAGFTLFPGKYTIKFLARDNETGRIGTYQTQFAIPDLNRESRVIPISSVVVSGQLVEMKDALYTSRKGSGQAANPLVEGTRKLVPSVTRVFHRSGPVFVYLQAYVPAGQKPGPIAAYVSLYRDQNKVFETPESVIADGEEGNGKILPVRFDLQLGDLAPGQYRCQVNLLDPNSGKVAFWSAPLVLLP